MYETLSHGVAGDDCAHAREEVCEVDAVRRRGGVDVEVEGAAAVFMTSCGWLKPPAEAAAAAAAPAAGLTPWMMVVPAMAPGASIVAAIAPEVVLVLDEAEVCA